MDKYKEIQYVNRAGVYLKNFKQVKARNWTFSHTCETVENGKKVKARGSIYEVNPTTTFNVHCYHCGYSVAFTTLLKEVSPALYDEYRLDGYREERKVELPEPTPVIDVPLLDTNLNGLKPVTSLCKTSPVIRFLERRVIPKKHYDLLYVAPHFYDWACKYKPEFSKFKQDKSPRLVMPYFNVHGRVLGFTARTFSPKVEPRYIHLRLDKENDFIYGTERIDPAKTIYVTEGQIDSLFVDNAVAVGGAHYGTAFMDSIKSNAVIIPDNDWKRNSQVGKQLKKAIMRGFKVTFLPDNLPGKDLNDLAKNGMSISEIKNEIDKHIKSGLSAMLEFAVMKKY